MNLPDLTGTAYIWVDVHFLLALMFMSIFGPVLGLLVGWKVMK